MISQLSIESLTDEIEKIALSRWKRALQAGELDDRAVGALRRLRKKDPAIESLSKPGKVRQRVAHTADPKGFRKAYQEETGEVPGTVLDYRREIAGLDEGAENIAAKKGITIIEGDPEEAIGAARKAKRALKAGRLREAAREGREMMVQSAGSLAAQGGGGLALPTGQILLSPSQNVIASGAGINAGTRGHRAVAAVTKRHEVNEQLAKAKQRASGGREMWTVTKTPENELEKLVAKATHEQMKSPLAKARSFSRKARVVADKAERIPLIGGKLKRLTDKVRGKADDFVRNAPEEGKLLAGRHISPEVLMRESRDVASMPANVQGAFRQLRDPAEMKMMGQRFDYGTAPSRSTQKQIMRDFERGAV